MESDVAERGLRKRNDCDKAGFGLRFSRRSSIMQRGKAARSACRSPVSRVLRYIIPEECSRNNKRNEKELGIYDSIPVKCSANAMRIGHSHENR